MMHGKWAVWLIVTLCCLPVAVRSQPEPRASSTIIDLTCGPDELNHSILVECNATSCGPSDTNEDAISWPKKSGEILHILSSRAGARLKQVHLTNLNFEETANEKLLDINTTLTVYDKIKTRLKTAKVIGFGATINISGLIPGAGIDKTHRLILDDLLGEAPSSGHLNILRLPVEVTNRSLNLSEVLLDIDQHVASARNYDTRASPLKIIIEIVNEAVQHQAEGLSPLEIIRAISGVVDRFSSIEIWALALNHTFFDLIGGGQSNNDQYEFIRKSLPTVSILASTAMVDETASFVDRFRKPWPFRGLLLKGQQSVPYNVLEYLSSRQPHLEILVSVGSKRHRTHVHGDWDNAQNMATEIVRHLQHGSMGFVDSLSVNDVLVNDGPNEDSSLYNLHVSHQTHFKGPMFYAMAHFSRYILPGSEILDTNIFTQANMFMAHYMAAKTADNFIVVIVLNGNDHMIPFRLELDSKIIAYTGIESKSFNTIIIKS